MSPQPQYIITPWRTLEDLLVVRRNLYTPSTISAHAHAIATVHAWKQRGNLPHAVESSALLFEALFFHRQQQQQQQQTLNLTSPATATASHIPLGAANTAIRASYTLALSRFVTGFADLGRHRTGPGQSMFDVARSIDLPPHFVELRHEAAHEDMPSLARLVRSTEEAVAWLWKVYWAGLDVDAEVADLDAQLQSAIADTTSVLGTAGHVSLRSKLRVVLQTYKTQKIAVLRAGRGKEMQAAQVVRDAIGSCNQLCGKDASKWQELAIVVIDERFIVPSERRLGASMQGAHVLWDDLLLGLADGPSPFRKMFIEHALVEVKDCSSFARPTSDAEVEAVCTWLAHMLTSKKGKTSAPNRLIDMVLEECCLHPSHWMRELGKLTLKLGGQGLESMWASIFSASIPAEELDSDIDIDDEDQPDSDGEYKSGEAAAKDMPRSSDSQAQHQCWRRDSGPWKAVPIGVVVQP